MKVLPERLYRAVTLSSIRAEMAHPGARDTRLMLLNRHVAMERHTWLAKITVEEKKSTVGQDGWSEGSYVGGIFDRKRSARVRPLVGRGSVLVFQRSLLDSVRDSNMRKSSQTAQIGAPTGPSSRCGGCSQKPPRRPRGLGYPATKLPHTAAIDPGATGVARSRLIIGGVRDILINTTRNAIHRRPPSGLRFWSCRNVA